MSNDKSLSPSTSLVSTDTGVSYGGNITKLEDLKKKYRENKNHFKSALSEVVYYTTYSRWMEDIGRRETWSETIERFMSFMKLNLKEKLTDIEYNEIHNAILNQEIVPSMRLLWSAGKAANATHVAAYNCSFISLSDLKDFSEIMYISMCGCGVGFSVEDKNVVKFPQIKEQSGEFLETHVVGDSKEGWCDAFYLGLSTWFDGKDINFDYSKVRPQGARLETMGGRASGPAPLISLMEFARERILDRQGSKLTSLDLHDLACKVGEIVVAGGVRRSALISLSDLNDEQMRYAKHGMFWETAPQRSMANNSAIYETKPSPEAFLDEWSALIKSQAGERGIFNRGGLEHQMPERRVKISKEHFGSFGTNPCGEIYLRSRQFCNLTSIVVRAEDSEESLLRKIRLATVLGTYQATLTDFPYLRPEWKQNCEEEALLGVSLTGYFDNSLVRKAHILSLMRDYSVKVNKEYAERFMINQSTCITCVKPSGNSSQLLDTASGMHPRYAKFYIRRIRVSSFDPIAKMLKDQGVPVNPEVGSTWDNARTWVFEFPVKSPDNAIVKDDVSAISLLEEWKNLKQNFTEHNPSATIYVSNDEWLPVASWIYSNWDSVGGLSFLPRSEHVYKLAPYEEIDEKTYLELSKKVQNIDFSELLNLESTDHTTGAKEAACAGGSCEL